MIKKSKCNKKGFLGAILGGLSGHIIYCIIINKYDIIFNYRTKKNIHKLAWPNESEKCVYLLIQSYSEPDMNKQICVSGQLGRRAGEQVGRTPNQVKDRPAEVS